MNYTEAIELKIDKLVGTLKDEDELEEVLKKKFTKKEFKVFVAFSEGKSLKEVKTIINDDDQRIEEIYKTACKKLNQEKIKKELVFFK